MKTRSIKLLSLFVFVLVFFTGESQTITIGSGSSRTGTQEASPVNIWYRRSVSQIVYTAAEINSQGITGPALITELGFHVRQRPNYDLPDYTIKMKSTSAIDVSSSLGTTGWTEVKSAFNYTPSNGWDILTLDQPFYWDGVSNIGVELCWSQVQPTYDASGRVTYYTATNGYRYSWTDAAGTSCGETPSTITTSKPKVRLTFTTFPTSSNWTGALSTDWFNDGNWSDGVPEFYMDAIIPSGLTNYPNITATSATAKDLTIQTGASLTISGSNELTLYGDWINNGTFVPNQSVVIFEKEGTNVNDLSGGVQDFYSIQANNSNGLVFASGTYNIYGGLSPNSGTITTNGLVILESNATSTGRIDEIKTACTWTLDMQDSYGDGWNGGYLTLYEDGQVIGSYSASGTGSTELIDVNSGSTLTMDYTSGSWENENTYTLSDPSGAAVNSGGPNISTGTTLYSGSYSCPISTNPIVGNVRAKRFLNIANDGWRELTSPITSKTLLDYQNNGLVMAGFPGSDWPNFGWISVYTYDETLANGIKENGWVAASDISNSINPVNADRIYIGSGTYILDVNGGVNFGKQTFNLSYQNILASETAANANQKGWNFIGNPYPCPIDWDAIPAANKVNMHDAISVWSGDAGNYAVYVGGSGAGTNGLTNNIPSFQGFWVHATSTGATLTIEEHHKANVDAPIVKSFSSYDFMKVKLTGDQNDYYDEAIVDFDINGKTYFEDGLDAMKLFSPIADAPSLSFLIDSVDISVNNVPLNEGLIIPIRTKAGVSGNYSLTFTDVLSTDAACIVLEDTYTGIFTTIDDSTTYNFTLSDTTEVPRFNLRILPASSSTTRAVSCYAGSDGKAIINFTGDAPHNYAWNGVSYSTNLDSVEITNLASGIYPVEVASNMQGCSSTTFDVLINEPQPLSLSIKILGDSCSGCLRELDIQVFGGSDPYQIYINGAVYDKNNQYSVGDYLIEVIDNNGCTYQESIYIDEALSVNEKDEVELRIYPNPADDYVIIESADKVAVRLMSITGELVSKMTVQSKHRFDTSNLPAGIYFIQVIETGKAFKLVVN